MWKKVILTLPLLVILLSSLFLIIWHALWREKEFGRWHYYGRVISADMITDTACKVHNVKDPESVRLPDHALFRDTDGYCHVVLTALTCIGVFKTKNIQNYTYVGSIDLSGKVAPYCVYSPHEEIFLLFYTDWGNTVNEDIVCGRLGLAVGGDIRNTSSFKDKGYLEIMGNLLPGISAGSDPYLIETNGTYYMIFSAAELGMHVAFSRTRRRSWIHLQQIIDEKLENLTLSFLNGEWCMMLGIHGA